MTTIKSDDNILIENLLKIIPPLTQNVSVQLSNDYEFGKEKISNLKFDYPFDAEVTDVLNSIIPLPNYNSLYAKIEEIKKLWNILIDKSIKCLRFFDLREPYLEIEEKHPQSYGLKELTKYYEEFAQFEALLYGSNRFYRDHVIHLIRTWLIGMNILIYSDKKILLYEKFTIEGDDKKEFSFNFFECISIWTIASLCHDLGYPLEKFKAIINKTQNMMEYLVSQPKITQDIAFSGTQDKLNEYIVRFISSKMNICHDDSDDELLYSARTQSKYYMKYSKSLEDYKHGIISSIIIYKTLLYFLESDYSFHEDYRFNKNSAKQFYFRRDILRCIASHTCRDIYHLYSTTFPLLLIISDDLQDWGRKRWMDIYQNNKIQSPDFNLLHYDEKYITIEYVFNKIREKDLQYIVRRLYDQFEKFRMLFRDGQDTVDRNFNFYVVYLIKLISKKELKIKLSIPEKQMATFQIHGEGYFSEKHFRKIIRRLEDIPNPKEIESNYALLT